MQNNHILNALRSPNATLAVLVLALIAQIPHAADVFRLIVQGADVGARLHSYGFAIALEMAVLLFVVQNRHAESYGFAIVSIAMNLSYYHLHNVQLLSGAALPALLVSIALPVAIARYSHAVADAEPHSTPVQPDKNTEVAGKLQESYSDFTDDIQSAELIVHDDVLPALQSQIASLQSEGFDAKWIATHGLLGIAGAQLAPLLGVNASTISRWRKAAQRNGHSVQEVA